VYVSEKIRPVEIIPGIWGEEGGEIKENDERVNSAMIIIRTFVNVTMYA
jgi:hypothetical protein